MTYYNSYPFYCPMCTTAFRDDCRCKYCKDCGYRHTELDRVDLDTIETLARDRAIMEHNGFSEQQIMNSTMWVRKHCLIKKSIRLSGQFKQEISELFKSKGLYKRAYKICWKWQYIETSEAGNEIWDYDWLLIPNTEEGLQQAVKLGCRDIIPNAADYYRATYQSLGVDLL